MTVLSGQTIRKLCQTDRPMLSPFAERGVSNGKSYGLSIAGYDIRLDKFLRDGEVTTNSVKLMPGDFILASSIERFDIPDDVIGIVHDKSSWARLGIAVQNTVAESGWQGFLTLEITLHKPRTSVILNRGDPIAQVIFQRLDEPAEKPYSGKYQNQAAEPVEALSENDNGESLVDSSEGKSIQAIIQDEHHKRVILNK